MPPGRSAIKKTPGAAAETPLTAKMYSMSAAAQLQRNVGNQAIAAQKKDAGGFAWSAGSAPVSRPQDLHSVGTNAGAVIEEFKPPPRKQTLQQLASEVNESPQKKATEAHGGFGTFVGVKLAVIVPMEVPSLTVTFAIEGEWSKAGKKKELDLKLDITAGFLWFEGKEFQSLKLEGEDLAASFEDAAKQIVHLALQKAGADVWLKALATSRKLRFTTIALYPFLTPLILAAPWLWEKYKNELKNDSSVGFEASFGVGLALTDMKDDKISIEALTGIKDVVDGKEAVGFTETAKSAKVTHGKSSFEIRASHRESGDKSEEKTLDVKAEMEDAEADPAPITQGITALVTAGAIGRALAYGVEDFVKAVAVAFPLPVGDSKLGLEMSFTKDLGGKSSPWTCKVRIKKFQSFESSWKGTKGAGGVKFVPATAEEIAKLKPKSIGVTAEVKYGTFLDISSQIAALLNALEPMPLATKSVPPKQVRR